MQLFPLPLGDDKRKSKVDHKELHQTNPILCFQEPLQSYHNQNLLPEMCVQQMGNKFYLVISQQNDVGFLFIFFPTKIKMEQLAHTS